MCVIYACSTALPPEEELKRGADRNDDGAGIAWLQKGKEKDKEKVSMVHWIKGLKDDEAVKAYITNNKIPFPLVIHFRSASVGGKLPELCHPFPVAKDAPLWVAGRASKVLFHNGHVVGWDDAVLKAGLASRDKFPTGPWSDSRGLAWLTYLKGEGVLPFVLDKGRVVVFNSDAPEPEEGEEPDPERFFDFYGTWIYKKEGWAQSTLVESYDFRRGSGNVVRSTHEAAQEHTPSSSTAVKVNTWSVQELMTELAEMRKELDDARTVAGA